MACIAGGMVHDAPMNPSSSRFRTFMFTACAFLAVAVLSCGLGPGADDLDARDTRYRVNFTKLALRTLKEHERLGGHTIERHVAKSDSYLRNRLRRSRRMRAASTFYDMRTAQGTVQTTIRGNKRRVLKWLKKARPRARLALFYRGRRNIGKTLRRGYSRPRGVRNARVILQARSRTDFFVLTAYPQ